MRHELENETLQPAVRGLTSEERHELRAVLPAGGDVAGCLAELEGLALVLRHGERALPPPGLCSRVMAGVPLRRPGLGGRLQDWYQRQLGVAAWLPGRIIAATAGRCHYFFHFVGLLHVGMGLVLAAELQGYAHMFPSLVGRQPELAYALAALLFCLGMLAARRTPATRALARLGLVVYMAVVLGNGLGIAASFAAHGAVLAAVALSGCGLVLGSFLGTILFTCAGERRHA
ncbi:hypothetical protein [Megalodesulfovibrio gigas]|uniref:Uncharacterized protein n=1 Tax=Megalodesulfovibrio gigas (strain ATCC 19364 / DSM 1382 / NCIMB 9332 / VKM B-1759) TaxID=1121448 RepID=T2GDL7_MEGG1|nr:hypothetical protein [Megalodesulfovibrio gigas]AGW14403.1 hypothetical protein DGI_2672 [Megalodesulfovibrio gigas DSM 1382 = ATCC 19364]